MAARRLRRPVAALGDLVAVLRVLREDVLREDVLRDAALRFAVERERVPVLRVEPEERVDLRAEVLRVVPLFLVVLFVVWAMSWWSAPLSIATGCWRTYVRKPRPCPGYTSASNFVTARWPLRVARP